MKVSYFSDTDTLYLELRATAACETRDLDENTLVDLDDEGQVCAITFEHASRRTELGRLQVEGLAA